MAKRVGQKLLRFDRNLGARLVAGADEAGRGPLAGPLVVAGVLLDYECLRDHKVRPLALLNDSKQVDPATREELYRAVLACADAARVGEVRGLPRIGQRELVARAVGLLNINHDEVGAGAVHRVRRADREQGDRAVRRDRPLWSLVVREQRVVRGPVGQMAQRGVDLAFRRE